MLAGKTTLTSHNEEAEQYTATGRKMHIARTASTARTETAAQARQRQGFWERALEAKYYFYSRSFKFELAEEIEPVLIHNL